LRYHHDRHGNVTALLGRDGEQLERYTYDAFGKPTSITDWYGNGHYDANGHYASWYDNRFMFQGREWLGELGIYDYRHRMYDPKLGRFLQTDPTGFADVTMSGG
jgi:RHS repeat-associated protein